MRKLMNQLIQPDSLDSYDLTYLENPKFKNWSIFKDTAQLIGRYCETVRPKNIVEFGTGLSTLIFTYRKHRIVSNCELFFGKQCLVFFEKTLGDFSDVSHFEMQQ